MKESVLVFANPIAGKGKGRLTARVVSEALRKAGYEVELFLKKVDSVGWSGEGKRVAASVVIGGDGTLRGVAQWAIDHAKKTGMEVPPLLVVPMGTANLMGKHLGVSWDKERLGEEVARTVREHRIVKLDVAHAEGGPGGAADVDRGVFLLMAGIGFDAWVVHELDRIRTGPIDHMKYVIPTIKGLQSYRFAGLRVEVDGRAVFDDGPALAMVGNVREYGTGFAILPEARADDGVLDVCVMPVGSIFQLVELAVAIAAGEHRKREGVVYVKGKRVKISADEEVPVHIDGEPAGMTPLEVCLLEQRIPFMVPGGA